MAFSSFVWSFVSLSGHISNLPLCLGGCPDIWLPVHWNVMSCTCRLGRRSETADLASSGRAVLGREQPGQIRSRAAVKLARYATHCGCLCLTCYRVSVGPKGFKSGRHPLGHH